MIYYTKDNYLSLNLIKKYSYNLNYYKLSKNPNITQEFILKYPNKKWNINYLIKNNKITNFKALSKFKNIDQYIINKYPNKPWDWEWLIENTNIKKYKNIQYCNSNFTENFIIKYPYQNWDIIELIKNNKITDFKALSKFKNIDQKIIDNYLNKPWDWEWLIENTDIEVECYIPFNLIEKYSYKWNYWNLSYNPTLKKEFILKYPYQNWNINYLIKNNKITNFKALSKFKNIDQYIINKYINDLWDWEWLIENTDIKLERYIPFNLIEKYPYKWNYWRLSFHPELTEEFIIKYPNKNWNKKYLSKKFIFKKFFYKFEIY